MPSSSPDHQAGLGSAVFCMSRGFRGRLVLGKAGWGFHWLTDPVGGEKKRKKKIKFQFPSIALGLCNQLTVIVRQLL